MKIIDFRQRVNYKGFRFHGSEDKQYFINDFFTYSGGKKECLIDAGAYSSCAKIGFSGTAGQSSKIVEGVEVLTDIITIDSIKNIHRVTFIKMDIEGAELEALKGARETILRDKPKLAICLYYQDPDFVDTRSLFTI